LDLRGQREAGPTVSQASGTGRACVPPRALGSGVRRLRPTTAMDPADL